MVQDEFPFYKPCKFLQPYVRYYWVFKGYQPLNTLTFPQIIFHKQTPLYIPELKTAQSEFTISGQVNYPSHLYADGNVEMIVVVLSPFQWGNRAFIKKGNPLKISGFLIY